MTATTDEILVVRHATNDGALRLKVSIAQAEHLGQAETHDLLALPQRRRGHDDG